MTRKIIASASIAALFLMTILIQPASAAPAYSLFGEASETGGSVTLVSDASPGFAGIAFAVSGMTLSQLHTLSTDFNVTDDDCVAGSPRFQIRVQSGSTTKNIFAYLGPSPSFTGCTQNTWTPSGDLLQSGATLDTSQLQGGTFYHSYSGALAMFGHLPVTGVQLVVDSGFASGGEQTVKVDNVRINNDTYNFAAVCTPVNTANRSGYWKFDEGSGTTAIDSAGGNNNGTLTNGPTYSSGATAVSPNPYSLRFDGTDDYVDVANSNDFRFGTGSFTVSTFVKTGSGDNSVLGNFNGSRGWGLFFYDTNERINFFGYGTMGTNDTSFAAPGLLNDQWHHVAGVYTHSGNSLKIDTYFDGALIGTHTVQTGDITASGAALHLGHYTGQPHYEGKLDEVQVFGRALSAAEIMNLSNGCTAGSSSSSSSSSSVSSSSSSSVSSVSSSSSSSSAGPAPTCDGQTATIYVSGGIVVGGPDNGDAYDGDLKGTSGNDVIVGTASADDIDAKGGDDRVCAGNGADEIDGKNGNDRLFGEGGNDILEGDNGDDRLEGGGGMDELDGGNGMDFLSGMTDADELDGGLGADVMCGGGGGDTIEGGSSDDKLDGGGGTDTLEGDSGTDICRNGESLDRCENTSTAIPECAGL